MGRLEGALARKQEYDPHAADQEARLERKKLALQKTQETQQVAQEEQEQRDRTEYLLKSPERFIMLSENEHALTDSLLRDFERKPVKSVIDQLKKVQMELSFIKDHSMDLVATPAVSAVAKRNTTMLKELETAVGPIQRVKETSGVLDVLRRMALELEGRSATTERSEYIGKHRPQKSQPSSPMHEPKVIVQQDKYQNPFAS